MLQLLYFSVEFNFPISFLYQFSSMYIMIMDIVSTRPYILTELNKSPV